MPANKIRRAVRNVRSKVDMKKNAAYKNGLRTSSPMDSIDRNEFLRMFVMRSPAGFLPTGTDIARWNIQQALRLGWYGFINDKCSESTRL